MPSKPKYITSFEIRLDLVRYSATGMSEPSRGYPQGSSHPPPWNTPPTPPSDQKHGGSIMCDSTPSMQTQGVNTLVWTQTTTANHKSNCTRYKETARTCTFVALGESSIALRTAAVTDALKDVHTCANVCTYKRNAYTAPHLTTRQRRGAARDTAYTHDTVLYVPRGAPVDPRGGTTAPTSHSNNQRERL